MHKDPHTEIFLSGVEGDRFMDTAYNFAECRRVLMSFLYAGNKGSLWFQNRLKKYPDAKFMADSGAHTFRTESFEFEKTNPQGDPSQGVDPRFHPKFPNLQWFEDYICRYRDWISQNRQLISLCVNLDIDNVVGMEKVLEWDYDIFRPLERQGVPVCYVWHENYGFDFWLKMCREHEYVGLPGHLSESEYQKMLKPAIMNGCRVHGFALTKSFVIGRLPFASVDSISWKSGEMYGQTFNFEGSKLRVYDKNQKDQRKRFKAKYVAAGIDWELLEKDKAEQITQVNALAWKDYINYGHFRSERLAYWIKSTAAFDSLGDPKLLSANEILDFFTRLKFPYEQVSEKDTLQDFFEIRAFCARDPEVVFSLPDDRIDYWVSLLGLAPENNSRPEKEAEIRQYLYRFFYSIKADSAKPRTSLEDLEPKLRYTNRDELPPVAAAVEADLEEEAGHRGGKDFFFVCYGPETNAEETDSGSKETDSGMSTNESGNGSQDSMGFAQVSLDSSFANDIEDRILRAQAVLGLELIFDQLKLKHEAQWLKVRRKKVRTQKELNQKARSYAEKITDISDALGPAKAEMMRDSAEKAYQEWKKLINPKGKEEALKKQELSLRPQNRLTPQQAREMGRRGGAPKGNQNARKHGLYSDRMPNLACDNCPHIQMCPQYRAGHVCAYLNEFNRAIEVSEDESPEMAAVSLILVEQVKRARRALLQETFEGGIINKDASKVLKEAMSAAQLLHQMKNPSTPFGHAPQPPPKKEGPSIMAALFGNAKDAEVIEKDEEE